MRPNRFASNLNDNRNLGNWQSTRRLFMLYCVDICVCMDSRTNDEVAALSRWPHAVCGVIAHHSIILMSDRHGLGPGRRLGSCLRWSSARQLGLPHVFIDPKWSRFYGLTSGRNAMKSDCPVFCHGTVKALQNYQVHLTLAMKCGIFHHP